MIKQESTEKSHLSPWQDPSVKEKKNKEKAINKSKIKLMAYFLARKRKKP